MTSLSTASPLSIVVSLANGSLGLLVLSALTLASCKHDGEPTPAAASPPACVVDGTWIASATQSSTSGGVCGLDDAKKVEGEISMRRTGEKAVWIERKGKHGHTATLDPTTCTLSTENGPEETRHVLGASFTGTTSYQVRITPDGTLSGTLNVQVRTSSILVSGCTATYEVAGKHKT